MMLALESLAVITIAELLLWWRPLWQFRRMFACALVATLIIASTALVAAHASAWTILVAAFSVYRCINLTRIAANRIQADYLFHTSRQTTFWLVGAQIVVAALAALNHQHQFDPVVWWTLLAGVELGCAAVLLASTRRHVRTTSPPQRQTYAEKDLPTVTVAIPARNETTDLEACLQSLVASSYPKLEILVLDDCSQNKRTPEIIREFAHSGVRFIAGIPPPGQWLAKNYAYSQLVEEANGDVLLFCGVDTRFEPGSLDMLVRTLLQKQKAMLSVLPRNLAPKSRNIVSWITQPNRYAWELALPRRLLHRPPVLSTCWLITRQALEAAGGFQAVRRTGVPESYFARTTAGKDDGYSFLRSDAAMGVSCQKSTEEQRATAIRTRYLQLHRRPELTALVGLAELSILIWPPALFALSLMSSHWLLAGLSGLSFAINSFVYSRIFNLTYRKFSIGSVWLLIPAALYDIGLLNYSMWQYEFGEVLWKGRNVCIPVMRAIPKLPEA